MAADHPMPAESHAAAPIDAAALRARQERSRERIALVQRRAQRAKSQLEGRTTTATSRDRSVTLTVGPAGTLQDLTFGPNIAKLAPATLARTVLATYGEATKQAVEQTEAVVRELVGQGSPVLDLIRASAPDPPSEHRPAREQR